jgi:hypothetical protein
MQEKSVMGDILQVHNIVKPNGQSLRLSRGDCIVILDSDATMRLQVDAGLNSYNMTCNEPPLPIIEAWVLVNFQANPMT